MWSLLPALALTACNKELPEDQVVPEPASLQVDAPPPGAFVPAGGTAVVGSATGLTGLTVNGQPAPVTSGRFQTTLDLPRGITMLEARGKDATDHSLFTRHSVLAGDFAPADGAVRDAMTLRINQSGLDHLAGMLSGLLNPADLFYSMSANNPIYNYYEPHGLLVDDTDVDVYLTALTFDPLQASASTDSGVLHIDLVLPNPYIEMETWGTIAYLNDTTGDLITISASQIYVGADVAMDVGPDGTVTASMSNVVVSMPGFDAEWSYVWGVVDWLVNLFVDLQDTVEGLVGGVMIDFAPTILGQAFSALNTTFETELLGAPITLQLQLVDVQADPQGVAFVADLGVDVPERLQHQAPGYLVAPGGSTPSPDTVTQMSAALADDLVNRVLYEAWAGGMIDLTLSTDDGSLDPLMLGALGASTGSIHVSADLPPVVVQKNGQLTAQLGEVDIRIETPGGDQGNWLDVTLSGETALQLSVANNELVLGLGAPDLRFVVRDSDWGVSNETITNLLEAELPLDVILLLLGNFSFPLPEIEGFGIASATTARDASGVHTDLAIILQ